MTETEAQAWLRDTFGDTAFAKLGRFVEMLLAEASQQSLIARSTFTSVWARHIADSAQLVVLAPADGLWLDVGSGGGLPGVVVAILRPAPLILVEPRRKRAEFLQSVLSAVNLPNASIIQANVQAISTDPAAIVSARAVTNLVDMFAWTRSVVSRETLYLLPRGENAVSDLALAERAWQGAFHVKQSLTDPTAGIIVASQVRPR